MAIETNNIVPPTLQAPPFKGLFDMRATSSVFAAPHVGMVNPDDVQFKNHLVPTVPHGPVTMGLMQVERCDQPDYDRSKIWQAGPVRSFFRAMMRQQRMVRQP